MGVSPCRAVLCCPVLYCSAVQCCAVLPCALLPCCAVLCCAVLFCLAVQCCAALCRSLHCIAPCCAVLCCTVLGDPGCHTTRRLSGVPRLGSTANLCVLRTHRCTCPLPQDRQQSEMCRSCWLPARTISRPGAPPLGRNPPTPLLTNPGRHTNRQLSGCPPGRGGGCPTCALPAPCRHS